MQDTSHTNEQVQIEEYLLDEVHDCDIVSFVQCGREVSDVSFPPSLPPTLSLRYKSSLCSLPAFSDRSYLFLHPLKPQHQLFTPWMSGVGIFLLDAFVVNNVRRVIRIYRRRYQFHLCLTERNGYR